MPGALPCARFKTKGSMSLAPTSPAKVKIPVSPKAASTQVVASETATNTRARISAVIKPTIRGRALLIPGAFWQARRWLRSTNRRRRACRHERTPLYGSLGSNAVGQIRALEIATISIQMRNGVTGAPAISRVSRGEGRPLAARVRWATSSSVPRRNPARRATGALGPSLSTRAVRRRRLAAGRSGGEDADHAYRGFRGSSHRRV